jgi:amino acid adenylation domain-containing protein/non-ribosomal peptide synthase protein (TIGR01720 family)
MQQETMVAGYRLSPQQQRLWELLRRVRGDAPFRAQCAVLIEGPLDSARLRAALGRVVARHEIMRTTFRRLPGLSLPVQVVGDSGPAWLPGRDLKDLDAGARPAAVDRMFASALSAPLDHSAGPLVYASLCELSREQSVLLLGASAACLDGASLDNVVRELARAYGGEDAGDDATQYADVAEYLNELGESEEAEAGRAFWRQSDISSALEVRLPFERRAFPGAEFEPAEIVTEVGPELFEAVVYAAGRRGVSVETFLLSCWQVLLWKLTRLPALGVGVLYDGRQVEGLEEMPGLFARYLPLASRVEGALPFDTLLASNSLVAERLKGWQDVFNWQMLPDTTRDGEQGYFPACFEFEETPPATVAGGVSFDAFRHYACIDAFRLKLSCRRRGGTLDARLHYDAAAVGGADAVALAEQFRVLLRSAAEDTAAVVGRLDLLGDDERRLLLAASETRAGDSTGELLHRRVEGHAAARPEARAVSHAGVAFSFAELNSRANRLARRLRAHGVGPDALVAVFMERSPDLVVSLLGVLKAGGAYVPLDPNYPRERLAYVLEDARAPVLLTQAALLERVPVSPRTAVICVDERRDEPDAEVDENLHGGAGPDNLAYVLYTSGSTGRPKGVMVTHGALSNYLSWCRDEYHVGEGGGAPVHSPVGFDLTVTSLLAPLAAGSGVTLLDAEGGVEELAAELVRGRDFSLVKLTPAHVESLNSLKSPEAVEGAARAFIIGGEALYAEHLSFWRTNAPRTRLINEYGPTEATVGCCVYEVKRGDPETGPVKIGRPIAGAQIFVLDERMRLAPFNVVGEIYVGGLGLARGYLNRPALTAERFVPNPFSAEPGARLYRTGDLARRGVDGEVEFLGRNDEQVKVRGFRIELGEIEAALTRHAAVREAVVVLREDSGGRRLAAYFVTAEGAAVPGTVALREYLGRQLPDYMLPATFTPLGALPLTANGKVDRRALPAPDQSRPELGEAYAPPRTRSEEVLAELWAHALGVECVGVHDDFFKLGGDSILSIQIANRAAQAGLKFTPRQVFQHRTIAALCGLVQTTAHDGEGEEVSGRVPLTPVQHWFFEQEFAEPHHWNQAVMFEARCPLDPTRLDAALRHVVAHHDALRFRFVCADDGWQQWAAAAPSDAQLLTVVDLSGLTEGEQDAAIEARAAALQASLDLSEGDFVRAAYFDLGTDRPARLLWVIHHLAVDVISWGILLDALQTAYGQLSEGVPVRLAPRSTSFKTWAERLREYARSPALAEEAGYWLDGRREGAAPLPRDNPEGENTEASVGVVWAELGAEETKALLQQVPKVYRTMINDVLLTALARAFARWTGESSLLLDLESHGREELFDDVDLSRTVGWFTCIFPVLLDLRRAAGPGEALKAIKEQVRGVPGGGVGYGVLRYLSEDERTRSRLGQFPEAEVSFNYIGRSGQTYSENALLVATSGPVGPAHSPHARRRYVFEVTGGVSASGRLRMAWLYSENLHRRGTVERLARGFTDALGEIIAHCLSPGVGGHTPSDFEGAGLNQGELDDLLAELSEVDD